MQNLYVIDPSKPGMDIGSPHPPEIAKLWSLSTLQEG
jgi:hypothetical protein